FFFSVQTVPERTKTYAPPLPLAKLAPTSAVSPEMETLTPNSEPSSASEGTSFCCSVQTPPSLTKMYAAAGWPPVPPGAPTTSVSPSTATEKPNQAPDPG